MGIVAPPPDSPLAKERAKWEKPYRYVPFPRMLYRASVRADGVRVCLDPSVPESKCQLVVGNEVEESRAMETGWRRTQKEALDWLESKENSIAESAAHRNYEDRNMGEKAKAEAADADAAAGPNHLPEVPEKPKRGRRRVKD